MPTIQEQIDALNNPLFSPLPKSSNVGANLNLNAPNPLVTKSPYISGNNTTGSTFSGIQPLPKQTSVVSSNNASQKASGIKTNIIQPYDQQVNAGGLTKMEADRRDAEATSDMKFLPGSGRPNPNYINPNLKNTETKVPKTNPLEDAQAEEILHPGQEQLYNVRTGEQEWVDVSGGTPSGFSKINPKTRTDVSSSIQDANGTTIDKLSDGTYRRVDINGNYTIGTAQMFNDAKRVQDLTTELDNLRKGIYTPNQKAQLDSIQNDYQKLISRQEVANANTTGATTIAMARSGLGNQILGQQQIDKTIRDGLTAVGEFTRERDGAIAKMKQAFEEDDVEALKFAYDIYNTSSQQIQDQIDKTQATIQNAKEKQELKFQANAIAMGNKYLDTEEPILITDTPEEVAAKVRTSPTWQAERDKKANAIDPAAVDAAYQLFLKGQPLPSGGSAGAVAFRNAVLAKIGGAPEGTLDEAVLNQFAMTGKKSAIVNQEKIYNATKSSLTTLDKTLDLVEKLSNEVDRTGSPVIAKYVNWIKGKGTGDEKTAQLQAAIKTASAEYSKILSGSAASIAGATVSSMEDAEKMFNENMSKGQIDAVIDILRQDSKFRVDGYKDTLDRLYQEVRSTGSTSTSSGTSSDDLDFDW